MISRLNAGRRQDLGVCPLSFLSRTQNFSEHIDYSKEKVVRDLGKTRKVFAKLAKCICEICVEFSLTKMKNSRVGNDC